MKTCCTCKLEQPLTEYGRHSRSKDGLKQQCKLCIKAYRLRNKGYMQDYYLKNKTVLNAKVKERRSQNSEYHRLLANRSVQNNWESNMCTKSRESARKKNRAHTLSPIDIKIPDTCPYLSMPLTRIRGKGRVDSNASLDRIDSTKGYLPDNIQVISGLANVMKSNATEDQLIEFAINVLRLHDTS